MLHQSFQTGDKPQLMPVSIANALDMFIAKSATPYSDTKDLQASAFVETVNEVIVTYPAFEGDIYKISHAPERSVDVISAYLACVTVCFRRGRRRIARIKHSYLDGVLLIEVLFRRGRPVLRS